MTTTLKITDQSTSGQSLGESMLELLTERITVRELIRSRVHQEVKDHNASTRSTFRGLVRPEGATHEGGGFRFSAPRTIDWSKQFETAVEAFERRQILILLDGKQLSELDEEITVMPKSEVTFVKLLPLVGG